jgi:hypothetical protein
MRRIRNIMLVAVFMLLIGVSFNVKAETFNYYLSNSKQNYEYVDKNSNQAVDVKRGDTVVVTVVLDNKDNLSNYKINSGKMTIRWDEKYLSLDDIDSKPYTDSISDVGSLTIGTVNKGTNKITLNNISSANSLKPGINKLVQYNFHVLENATSGVTKIYQMDGEDNLKCYNETEDKTINCGESLYGEIKLNVAKSSVNKLSMIKIDDQELEQFSEDNTSYDITVETNVTKIKIDATKKDSRSTITGDIGEKTVDYGNNKFVIVVTSESGEKYTYTLNVIRVDERSSINTLKTLTLSAGEISFNSSVLEYTVNVDNNIDKITITSSLTDAKSKYVTDYKNKEVELIEGSNKVEITVVSEKGEEKTYTLNINRALSSNNSLKTLKVNDDKITLVENEFIYNLEVENTVDEVIITAVPNDEKATVKLEEKYPLEVGENEINIKVVAASGQEASYIVNVTRKKILSKDSLLSNLKIKDYKLDFKQDVKVYDLKIKDEVDELEITATPEDATAQVEIEGNKDLEDGSIVKINVKAEDGTYTRYFINIEKGSSGIPTIIIILIVLLLLLGGCIGLIIYRKKKKENKEFDKLDQEENVPVKEERELNIPNEEYVGTHTKEENIDKEKDV